MDPNALLDAIEEMSREDEREAALMARDLHEWIRRGGFEPDWKRHADGAAFYHRFF